MGTIAVFRNVKIKINSGDHDPPHVHVWRGDAKAKIEIQNRNVISHRGFSRNDMKRILEFIAEQADLLMEEWYEIKKNQKKY